jgi:hypothetical protein
MHAWCQWLFAIGTNNLEFKTDALMVKQALLSNEFDRSEVGDMRLN